MLERELPFSNAGVACTADWKVHSTSPVESDVTPEIGISSGHRACRKTSMINLERLAAII
jgi:hypothetical protein